MNIKLGTYRVIRGRVERFTVLPAFAPLYQHVARVAIRNEIVEAIGFFVIIEITKANDMMHVKFLAQLFLGYATILAGIVVAFAGFALLSAPVGTVISVVTATPRGVIVTAHTDVSTLLRAKPKLASGGNITPINLRYFSASFTLPFYWWLLILAAPLYPSASPRVARLFRDIVRLFDLTLDNAKRPPFVKTIKGTYVGVFGPLNFGWGTLKSFITNRAFKLYSFTQFLGAQFVGTLAGASCLATMFQPTRIGLVNCSTDGAFSLYHDA